MTHDLRGEHRKLLNIVKYLQKISCSEIQDFGRCAYGHFIETNPTPPDDVYSYNSMSLSLSLSFGFNKFGRPCMVSTSYALSVRVEEYYGESISFKCALQLGCYKIIVVFGLGYMQVDQIYIIVEKPHPDYNVVAIGKEWDICTEKHAEFNLSNESIMYATLCGDVPMLGITNVVKCFSDIAQFAHIIFDYGIEQRECYMSNAKALLNKSLTPIM